MHFDCFWLQVTRSACHLCPPSRIQVCTPQQRPSDLHITTTHISCWTQTHLDPPHLHSDLFKNPFVLFGGILFLWRLLAGCGWPVKCSFWVFTTSASVHYEGYDLCMWMSDRKEWSNLSWFTVNEHANLMLFVIVRCSKMLWFMLYGALCTIVQNFRVSYSGSYIQPV